MASLIYAPKAGGTTGRWYAAVGHGPNGAVLVSADGASWQVLGAGSPLSFEGGNTKRGGLPDNPRSTGNLLAVDASGTWLYAGTFDQGIFRCRLGADPTACTDRSGGGFTRIGLPGPKYVPPLQGTYHYVRGMALNTKITPNRLVVAMVDVPVTSGIEGSPVKKVVYVDNPAAAPDIDMLPPPSTPAAFLSVSSPPSSVEELKYLPAANGNQYLYAVGAGGIFRAGAETPTAAPTFTKVNAYGLLAGLNKSGQDNGKTGAWTNIDGYATSTGSRVFVTSTYRESDFKSTNTQDVTTYGRTAYLDVPNSGQAGNLVPLDRDPAGTTAPPVNPLIPGTGDKWDLLTTRTTAVLGQKQYQGSQIMVDTATARLFLAGKQGIYRTSLPIGESTPFGTWDAAVGGLINTFAYGLSQDPRATDGSGRIVWPDADLIAGFTTATGNLSVSRSSRCETPNLPDKTQAMGVAHQSDGRVWISIGSQFGSDYSGGQLWSGTMTDTGCVWVDSGLAAFKGIKPAAFTVTGVGSSTVVWAYLPGTGLVRGVGDPRTAPLTWVKFVDDGTLPNLPSDSTQTELTKGVSMVTTGSGTAKGDRVVVARPNGPTWSTASGVHICTIQDPTADSPNRVSCVPAHDTAGRLMAYDFNWLALDPSDTTKDRLFWSYPGPGSANGQGVWSISMSTGLATRLTTLVGGPMSIVTNTAQQKVLVVAQGHPVLDQPTLYKAVLPATSTSFTPITPNTSTVDFLARSAMDTTGLLVTGNPAAPTQAYKIFVSTLGNGVMSGLLYGF